MPNPPAFLVCPVAAIIRNGRSEGEKGRMPAVCRVENLSRGKNEGALWDHPPGMLLFRARPRRSAMSLCTLSIRRFGCRAAPHADAVAGTNDLGKSNVKMHPVPGKLRA